jgi:hypothetical protein
MNRLTEKNDRPYSTDIYDIKINEYDYKNYSTGTSIGACLDKLGKLEDLEEQLGCPLEVAVKALFNGVYESYIDYGDNNSIKIRHREVRGIGEYGLIVINLLCSYAECDETFIYKDYKKTWWLKEDKSE